MLNGHELHFIHDITCILFVFWAWFNLVKLSCFGYFYMKIIFTEFYTHPDFYKPFSNDYITGKTSSWVD